MLTSCQNAANVLRAGALLALILLAPATMLLTLPYRKGVAIAIDILIDEELRARDAPP